MTDDLFDAAVSGFGKGKVNIFQAKTRFMAATN
jgi:hypothetical protein